MTKFGVKDQSEVQSWVESLSKSARLDAKVDSGKVVVQTKQISAYDQVMRKTKSLYQKSNYLSRAVSQADSQPAQ